MTFGRRRYQFVTECYKICNITSWGSHSRLLKRAIINVQPLGDQTNSSVLWLKYNLNINEKGIFAIRLYFCIYIVEETFYFRGTQGNSVDADGMLQNRPFYFGRTRLLRWTQYAGTEVHIHLEKFYRLPLKLYEPHRDKTSLQCFRQSETQTNLLGYTDLLEN